MSSGVLCSAGEDDIWQLTVRWEGTVRKTHEAIMRWRDNHPGWETTDAADRAAVAELFPHPPIEWRTVAGMREG
jgi:hypothetical protein